MISPLDAFEEHRRGRSRRFDGARLRRARLRRGLELDDIASVTKINPTYLALHRGGALRRVCRRGVYVRGFVVAYARLPRPGRRSASRASYMKRYEERAAASKRRTCSLANRGGRSAAASWAEADARRDASRHSRSRRSPAISRSQARRWIDDGRVRLNDAAAVGEPARAARRRARGRAARAARRRPLEPEAIPLRILYEDADLIVLDKPAGHRRAPRARPRQRDARERAAAPLRRSRRRSAACCGRASCTASIAARRACSSWRSTTPRTSALAAQFTRPQRSSAIYRALVRGVPAPDTRPDRCGRSAGTRATASACRCTRDGGARGAHALARRSRRYPAASAPGSRCARKPGARTRSACTSPRSGCRSRAIRSTAGAAARAPAPGRGPRCTPRVLGFVHPAQRRAAALRGRAARGLLARTLLERAARARREAERRERACAARRCSRRAASRTASACAARAAAGLRRPRQVHGARVAARRRMRRPAAPHRAPTRSVSALARVPVGVVTADCVPMLAASRGRRARWRRSTPAGAGSPRRDRGRRSRRCAPSAGARRAWSP